MRRKTDVSLEKFKALVRFGQKTKMVRGCWLWIAALHGGRGAHDVDGYRCGSFWYKGRAISAHLFAWQMVFGRVPKGKQVNHTCGDSRCVNPAHMYLGTQAQNVEDLHRDGHANGKQRGGKVRGK